MKYHVKKKGSSQPSLLQAYTFVDAHCFGYPGEDSADREDFPLMPGKDPVEAIPSLKRLIEKFPEHQFFVVATYGETHLTGFISLYVRTLPEGVDEPFDTVLERFHHGTQQVKDRKLELFMNLGPGPGLSFFAWAALKTMNAVLKFKRNGEPDIPFSNTGDRTPFPGMTMSTYTKVAHFSGENYISHTCYLNANNMSNWAAKMLFQKLADGAVNSSILDFSYVIEGESEDELPERAVCTLRSVHLDFWQVQIPYQYLLDSDSSKDSNVEVVKSRGLDLNSSAPSENEDVSNADVCQFNCVLS